MVAAWLVREQVWGRRGMRRTSVVYINSWPSLGGYRQGGRDGLCPALLERTPPGTLTPSCCLCSGVGGPAAAAKAAAKAAKFGESLEKPGSRLSPQQAALPGRWASGVSPRALAWHRLVQGELGGFRGGYPTLGVSSHGSMGITRGSPPRCLTPSLRRCRRRRGARRGARCCRSARSDARRRRRARVGAGCGDTWYRHPPRSRYVLRHILFGDPLGDSSGRGC